jgi:hypothetical protein
MKTTRFEQKSRAMTMQEPIIAIAAEVFSATNSWARTGRSIPYIKKKLMKMRRVVMIYYNLVH